MERGRFNIKFWKRIIKFWVSMREKYQLQVFIKDWKEKYGLHTTTSGFEPITRTIHPGFNLNWHAGSTDQWVIRSEIFDGPQIRHRSRKHFLEMTLLPSTKRHTATPSLKGICDNLPPRTISIAVGTGSGSPSACTGALDLLPRRPLPPHRSYFPGGHYLHTGAASPSSTISAPDLLRCQPVPVHWICFPSATTSAPELLPP